MNKNILDSFIHELIDDEKSSKTINHYKVIITRLIEYCMRQDILDKQALIKYKHQLIEQYKPASVCNHITIINKFLKYSEREDLCLKNIKLQQKSSLIEVLEPVDLKRLLRKSKQLNQMELYFIMKIIAYTGIRIAELKVFTVENIRSNYISVSNKGKTRNVIIRQDLKRELKKYCKDNKINEGIIFKGKNNNLLHQSTIWKRMKLLAGKCRGISKSKVHAHSFRHLFAIKFISDGGDISELADILGHSSIDTTRIYTRTTDKMKKDRLERMKY